MNANESKLTLDRLREVLCYRGHNIGGCVISTVIIGGGGGHAAVDRLIAYQHAMTAEQQAKAKALIEKFCADVEELCAQTNEAHR